MTKFTESNTEGFTNSELDVLNAAYEQIMETVDPEFEDDTHAVSDGLNNSWIQGDTVESLVARFHKQRGM